MLVPEDHPTSRSRRWMHLFLAVQALLAIGLFATAMAPLGAPAAPPSAAPAEVSTEEEGSEEESEFEEECVEAEEEFCEEEDESEAASSAEKCFLRSAQAHSATKNNKLKVTVGYTTNRPVGAMIEIRQGSTRIGTFRRHLGKSGVLRFTGKLPKQENAGIAVRIRPSEGAAGCPSRRLVLFPH